MITKSLALALRRYKAESEQAGRNASFFGCHGVFVAVGTDKIIKSFSFWSHVKAPIAQLVIAPHSPVVFRAQMAHVGVYRLFNGCSADSKMADDGSQHLFGRDEGFCDNDDFLTHGNFSFWSSPAFFELGERVLPKESPSSSSIMGEAQGENKNAGSASVTERQPAAAVTAEASTPSARSCTKKQPPLASSGAEDAPLGAPGSVFLNPRQPLRAGTSGQPQDVGRGLNGRAFLSILDMLVSIEDHRGIQMTHEAGHATYVGTAG